MLAYTKMRIRLSVMASCSIGIFEGFFEDLFEDFEVDVVDFFESDAALSDAGLRELVDVFLGDVLFPIADAAVDGNVLFLTGESDDGPGAFEATFGLVGSDAVADHHDAHP